MKKAIFITTLALIGAVYTTFAQSNSKKNIGVSKPIKPDSSQKFVFNIAESQLLFLHLEEDKKLFFVSSELTARQANVVMIPRADSLERILGKQDLVFQRAKAHADSLKANSDTVKKAPPKQKVKETNDEKQPVTNLGSTH